MSRFSKWIALAFLALPVMAAGGGPSGGGPAQGGGTLTGDVTGSSTANIATKLGNCAGFANCFGATGATTGNAPTLSVTGSDTSINLALAAKGTGALTTTNPFIDTPTLSSSSAVQSVLSLFPTVSQTSTAGYNGLYIAAYENTTGSGNKYLINAGTSTAASGGGIYTSVFNVTDNGILSTTGNVLSSGFGTNGYSWFGGTAYGIANLTVFQNSAGFSGVNGLFFGSTTSASHVLATGNAQTTLSTNGMTHSNFYVGSVTSAVSTGVNVPFIAMGVIKSPGAITLNGTGTVTNTASLYVEANATTVGTNNYGLYSAGGYAQGVTNVTASATPALSATNGLQTITLSANSTPTITGIASGQRVTFQICQPATGGPYTWTWPTTIHGGMTIGTTANTCSIQSFNSFNGTSLVAESLGISGVAP